MNNSNIKAVFASLATLLVCSFVVWVWPEAAYSAAEFTIGVAAYIGLLVLVAPHIDDAFNALRVDSEETRARARN